MFLAIMMIIMKMNFGATVTMVKMVPYYVFNDGYPDCSDGSDEVDLYSPYSSTFIDEDLDMKF